jgi:acetate kinase
MKVLTLNSGSSSLRYKLFEAEGLVPVAAGRAERIGEEGNRLVNTWRDVEGIWREREWPDKATDHHAVLEHAFADLAEEGLLRDRFGLLGIGHRVVHGGERFTRPTLVNAAVYAEIRALEHLAPLHNPANLLGIEVARRLCRDIPQVAVFDTAFHATLPPHASHYALPQEVYEQFHVRRYGFHGTSISYVSRCVAERMGRPVEELNLIVLHLGNGASATAVAQGAASTPPWA